MKTSDSRPNDGLPAPLSFGTQAKKARSGTIGWVLLWLLGVPLPVLLIIYLIFA